MKGLVGACIGASSLTDCVEHSKIPFSEPSEEVHTLGSEIMVGW